MLPQLRIPVLCDVLHVMAKCFGFGEAFIKEVLKVQNARRCELCILPRAMAGGKFEPANGDLNNVVQPLAKDGLVSWMGRGIVFIKHRPDPSRPWC